MRRVLLISPYFPPHTGAGTHRIRLLAPHLRASGWEPTVLTVEPSVYEERLDPELLSLVPSDLRVVRVGALPARLTRPLGLGDLAARAFGPLLRGALRLLRRERYDAFLLTLPPHNAAPLGPLLKRATGVPFVLDYQDPWVGAWGQTVGGGPGGAVDLKSRASRWLGELLEPSVVRAADGLVGVSRATYEDVLARIPRARPPVCAEIPLGGAASDFEAADRAARENRFFDPRDGGFHLCYVGTVLPLGFETLRAVLRAAAVVVRRRPELAERLHLRFFGTSNRMDAGAPERVVPVARELGIEAHVHEVAPRVDYLDALTILRGASAILAMGSSERHYTASKLYPALLARRPLLAVYHEESLVSTTLARWSRPPSVRLITYGEAVRAEQRVDDLAAALEDLLDDPRFDPAAVDMARIVRSAEDLAGELARVLDEVSAAGAATR